MARVQITRYALYRETFIIEVDESLPESEMRDDYKGKTLDEQANLLLDEGEGGEPTESTWVDWNSNSYPTKYKDVTTVLESDEDEVE